MSTRDSQRSRVYAWERDALVRLTQRTITDPDFATLQECTAYADPIWRKERARVGLAGQQAPAIERPNRGQRAALAHHDHRITLPRWARSRWVILHEMAHRLTPKDVAHGPRFVGVLIGLAARWLDLDAQQLMAMADEHGVKYHVRSIGVVPTHGLAWHLERVVRLDGPMTEINLACHLKIIDGMDVTGRQVRGAALTLIRSGRARWLRKKLVLIGDAAPPPPAPPAPKKERRKPVTLNSFAAEHELEVDYMGEKLWMVYPGEWLPDDEDPHEGDHCCYSLGEAWAMAKEYAELRLKRSTPAAMTPA